MSDYASIPGINATAIKAGVTSMVHMHRVMTGDSTEQTPAMEWGTIVHAAILTGVMPVVYDGMRRGKEWDAFAAANEGRLIVKPDALNKLETMRDSIMSNPHAAGLLAGTDKERTLQWVEHFGPCKARLDIVGGGLFADLKTCGKIRPTDCERQFLGLGYHLQMGWYRRGLRATSNQPDQTAYVIALESKPPHCVVVYKVAPSLMDYGENLAVKIATEYAACVASGKFPGPCDDLREWSMPGWLAEQANALNLDDLPTMDAEDL